MMRHVSLIFTITTITFLTAQPLWAKEKTRPNFVIIIADDMAWNDCGVYGHPKIQTPNIDRLAAEGMRFDRAFLTCSSCSPSRCSILSGRYPHATGAAELHMPLPAEQILFSEPLRRAGYFTAALGKWHLGPAAIPKFDVVKFSNDGPGKYASWIPELRNRPKDKPFFFWLATTDPHRPYQPNTIPRPHTTADAVVPPFLPDVEETRGDLAMYYDEIGRLDMNVGKVVEELEHQGVLDNTLILFLSDNGRPFPRCKTTIYDSGVRTPFIVRWSGHVRKDTSTTSLVSSVDIAPTFLELAGLEPLPSFQGRSFAKILKNPQATTREYVFFEHNWHDYMSFERGLRSSRYHYLFNAVPQVTASPPADAVRSPTYRAMQQLHKEGKLTPCQTSCFIKPRPKQEFYDLKTDPYALKNLADDPAYAKQLATMRQALSQWKKRTHDVMPHPLTPDKFDRVTGERLETKKKKTKAKT